MNVYPIEVQRAILEAMPIAERRLFLTAGHIANELVILRKLILLSNNTPAESEIEYHAQACQSLTLVKLFALKACAGWEFLQGMRYQPFVQDYQTDADANLAPCLSRLGAYFSNNRNLLTYIRNKFAGHYDHEEINRVLNEIPDRTFHFYITEQSGNSLYYASEEILFNVLATQAQPNEDLRAIFNRLIDEVDEVAAAITDFAQGVMIVVAKKYFPDGRPSAAHVHDVTAIPSRNVPLPFFVDFRDALDEGDTPTADRSGTPA